MMRSDDFWAPRNCFLTPIPELDMAADLLSKTADALVATDYQTAREFLAQADMPVVYDYARKIMGANAPFIHRRRTVHIASPKGVKAEQRKPTALIKRTIYARDGWRCRFCGCRVVPNDARDKMRALLPGAIRLGPLARDYHAAFLALNAVPDHLTPRAAGGGNDLDNLVTACWPCNNGRGAYSLEEMGLIDPRSRPLIADRDEWDGLRLMMSGAGGKVSSSVFVPSQEMQAVQTEPRSAQRSRAVHLSQAQYFDLLESSRPQAVKPFAAFLASLREIGIVAEYRRSIVLRFTLSPGVHASAGWVYTDGRTYLADAYHYADKYGHCEIGRDYLNVVAEITDGVVRRYTDTWHEVYSRDGTSLDILELLQDAAGWKDAIENLIGGLRSKAKTPNHAAGFKVHLPIKQDC